MVGEAQTAQRVIRGWWPAEIGDADARAIIDGLSHYLQSRIIEDVYDRRHLRLAHSAASMRYFGGHIVWSVPSLRLPRTAVLKGDRYALMFAALERWIGMPTLQVAVRSIAQLPADRLTADAIGGALSAAAGQDLTWIFDAAKSDVSYAITELHGSSVTVTRNGSGMFTGRTAGRVGEFDSGDAIRLRVAFEDGTNAWASWDGRDVTRTFQFQGPSPIRAAHLDPDNIVTLDANRLDNAIVPRQPTNVPVRKWAARWMVWLQHTLLSYGLLA